MQSRFFVKKFTLLLPLIMLLLENEVPGEFLEARRKIFSLASTQSPSDEHFPYKKTQLEFQLQC